MSCSLCSENGGHFKPKYGGHFDRFFQESIKIPNLRSLNDTERKDKILQIIEKISKENNIPVSAFEEVFGDKKKKNHFFRILEGSNVLADDNLKFIKKLGR